MADRDEPPPAGPPAPSDPARRFKDAGDAARELHEHYGNWAGALGKYGLQFALALMAANWALHGTHTAILGNPWAKSSMAVALVYLAVTLVFMWLMVWQLDRQHLYADENKERWAQEYNDSADGPRAWPYTDRIEDTGRLMQWLHFLGPLLSGVLLLVSVFVSPAPDLKPGSQSCCVGASDDIAAIRRAVDGYVARPGGIVGSASAPVDGVVSVPGETRFSFAAAGVLAACLGLVVVGGLIFVRSGGAAAKAVGASMITVGALTGGGFALVKDVKVDSIFKIDMERLFDFVRHEVKAVAGAGPERLAFVDQFKLGDDRHVEVRPGAVIDVDDSPKIGDVADALLKGRADGKSAVLLVIGATDRLPINGAKEHRFEANVGLARARAEAVKRAIIAKCRALRPPCDLTEDQVIVLVSGPRQTPESAELPPARRRDGYPDDRRVDVWALWTRNSLEGLKR